MKILLYINTIRFLKIRQITYQLWYRVYKPKISKKKNYPQPRSKKYIFIDTAKRKNELSVKNEFCFLNKSYSLNAIGWNDNKIEKLWNYNLHYFNYLNTSCSNSKEVFYSELIEKWIDENNTTNSIGHESYPTSLRIVNWMKWHLTEKGKLSNKAILSIYNQGIMLSKNLEYHILGNHLFANVKALIFLGCFFSGNKSKHWLKKGISIINSELEIQINNDGSYFELSPMYHSIILEDILDLINVLRSFEPDESSELLNKLTNIVPKMYSWLEVMLHKDHDISFFNDSALDISSTPNEIENYMHRLNIKKNILKGNGLQYCDMNDSGYISVWNNDYKFILDAGKIGPDFLPAHSHADTLTFELSNNVQRIFVNSGTSTYEANERRHLERSTMLHNTVTIDQKNSSEVWSSFRVGRRAYPLSRKIFQNKNMIQLESSHDGYSRLEKDLIHYRKCFLYQNKIIIEDDVSKKKYSAIARFIVDSKVKIKIVDTNYYELMLIDTSKIYFKIIKGRSRVISWLHAYKFGNLIKTNCIEVELIKGYSKVEIVINKNEN